MFLWLNKCQLTGRPCPVNLDLRNQKTDALWRPFFDNHRELLFNRASIDPLLEKVKLFSGEVAKMLSTLYFDQLAVR